MNNGQIWILNYYIQTIINWWSPHVYTIIIIFELFSLGDFLSSCLRFKFKKKIDLCPETCGNHRLRNQFARVKTLFRVKKKSSSSPQWKLNFKIVWICCMIGIYRLKQLLRALVVHGSYVNFCLYKIFTA